jgi:hypothetical protein
VGSEGRFKDFNKFFLPKSNYIRSRWERVDTALIESIILPPIRLYEVGGVYFVRDGNHRVSVAKAQGVENIDAEVTSLVSEIMISPGMTTDDIRRAVLKMEKDVFYEKTEFGALTGCETLDFSWPGRYDVVYNHILVHKYFVNQHFTGELPFSDALVSWYDNVYDPIIQIIDAEGVVSNFTRNTPSDLYIFIVKRWDELKEKYGMDYSAVDAARDFTKNHDENKC